MKRKTWAYGAAITVALGLAIAWALAMAGARVAVYGRDESKARDVAAALCAAGHDATGLSMDAHSVPQMQASVDAVAGHFGRLDILVNCVGMQREQALLEVTLDPRHGIGTGRGRGAGAVTSPA